MLEDRLLIWKFKGGSNEALCRIYRKYGDYLLALAAALLQGLKSFLATCVVNRARDKLRARKSQPCDLDETAAMALDTNEPDHDAIFGEQARDLNRAIAQLAYEQREVILLHLRGGMKFREIADLQGTSINTAKSRYRYGLERRHRTIH